MEWSRLEHVRSINSDGIDWDWGQVLQSEINRMPFLIKIWICRMFLTTGFHAKPVTCHALRTRCGMTCCNMNMTTTRPEIYLVERHTCQDYEIQLRQKQKSSGNNLWHRIILSGVGDIDFRPHVYILHVIGTTNACLPPFWLSPLLDVLLFDHHHRMRTHHQPVCLLAACLWTQNNAPPTLYVASQQNTQQCTFHRCSCHTFFVTVMAHA